MSARSLRVVLGTVVAIGLSWALGSTVLADNACSYTCQVNFIPPGSSGSLSSCTTNDQCASFCATTCAALGTSPRAVVDNSHASTCSSGACTPCSCRPQVALNCTSAGTCATSCTSTCNAYPRPAGVQSVACRTSPPADAPSCITPERPASGSSGFCQYACIFGATRAIRTTTRCTPSSPSECAGSLSSTTCAGANLATSSIAPTCSPNSSGTNTCVITCSRPTAVPDTAAGTCTPNGPPNQAADRCLNNCQTTCAGRGMVCNDTTVRCNGTGSSGTCHFECAVATAPAPRDDRATVCSFSNDTTLTAATTLCANRCNAYCAEQGGSCATSPAARCLANENRPAGGGDTGSTGSTGGGNGGTTVTQRSSSPSRTAPIFHVEFPDPLGGRMTVPGLIGAIVRVLVGLCGIFCLGVFIYGGLLYILSNGDSGKVKKGQQAIVNAVIGLVIVLFSYVAVSFITQISNQVQTGNAPSADRSQDVQDDSTSLRPGGTTHATGRSSQDPGVTNGSNGNTPLPEPGTAGAACRSYYGADPANCTAAGGSCPRGVTDLGGLVTMWGRSFPAPSPSLPDPAASCRTCLQNGVTGLAGRFPGLDTSCIPALVNLWSTSCRDVCNPRATGATGGGTTGADICNPANYNTSDASCSRCITYWSASTPTSRAQTIASVGCPDTAGKVVVWCATAEAPAQTRRPQSGAYCRSVSTR